MIVALSTEIDLRFILAGKSPRCGDEIVLRRGHRVPELVRVNSMGQDIRPHVHGVGIVARRTDNCHIRIIGDCRFGVSAMQQCIANRARMHLPQLSMRLGSFKFDM